MVRKAISSFGKALTNQQTEILSIAGMLMVVGLITKFFGLFYNSLAVGLLGPEAYDAFIFASNIPELFSQIILFGTLSATVMPILAGVLEEKGQARLVRVFSTLINISLIVFGLAAFMLALTAGWTMPWFIENVLKPEDPVSSSQMSEIVWMLRILLIPQIILGISIYLSTALNLFERFLVPQLAPLFYNLGRIGALFIFIPLLGQTPWVLVWGTLLGSVLHLLIQVPLVKFIGLQYKPVVDIKDYYIHRIGMVALPRLLSMSAEQISISIDRFIAFSLVGNSLALYNLAILVISVPLNLFGGSFSTASFPILARAFARNDRIMAAKIFLKIYNQILFFSIPTAVLMLVLRVPISRLTFGIFGSEIGFLETYSIAWILLFFAPGLVFEVLRSFLYRAFYATHDTIRPLVVSVVIMIGGVATGILFTNYLSHFDDFSLRQLYFEKDFFFTRSDGRAAAAGLALSSTLVFTLEVLVLTVWLNRKYLHLPTVEFFKPVAKKLLAGMVMFVFTYFTYKIWAGLETNERTIPLVILTITTTASSAMVYIGSCGLLQIEEVDVYLQFLAKHPDFPMLKKWFRKFMRFDPIPDEII